MTKTKTTMRVDAYILGTLALAILSGCAKIEQREAEAVQLSWQVIQDGPTKAAAADQTTNAVSANSTKAAPATPATKASAYDTGDTFLSWAWYLPDGKSWSKNNKDAERYIGGETSGATIGYVSSKYAWKNVVWDGTKWNEGVSYYWPKAGKLSFFAASPSSLGSAVNCTAADGIKISDWDVNDHQDTDIMVADLITDQSGNTSSTGGWLTGVPTVFRHKLSMLVGFNFNTFKDYENGHNGSSGNKYNQSDITYLVTKIEITGYPQQGTFIVNAPAEGSIGQWSVSATSPKYNYTWYENASGKRIPYQSSGATAVEANSLAGGKTYLYLLPQQFTSEDAKLKITYIKRSYKSNGNIDTNSSTTAEVSLKDLFAASGNRLVMNRKITVNITFNNDSNLIFWAPDQSEWGSGEFDIYV